MIVTSIITILIRIIPRYNLIISAVLIIINKLTHC